MTAFLEMEQTGAAGRTAADDETEVLDADARQATVQSQSGALRYQSGIQHTVGSSMPSELHASSFWHRILRSVWFNAPGMISKAHVPRRILVTLFGGEFCASANLKAKAQMETSYDEYLETAFAEGFDKVSAQDRGF